MFFFCIKLEIYEQFKGEKKYRCLPPILSAITTCRCSSNSLPKKRISLLSNYRFPDRSFSVKIVLQLRLHLDFKTANLAIEAIWGEMLEHH